VILRGNAYEEIFDDQDGLRFYISVLPTIRSGMVEFGEWLCSHVLKKVPQRHVIFGIPMVLRRYCLYMVAISAIYPSFPAHQK